MEGAKPAVGVKVIEVVGLVTGGVEVPWSWRQSAWKKEACKEIEVPAGNLEICVSNMMVNINHGF